MSINMELMRKKLAALRGEGQRDSESIFFKPEEGDQDIRIVPTPDGDPLKEVFFHYNVGEHRGGIVCPKRNFGERCPVCVILHPQFGRMALKTMMRKLKSWLNHFLCAADTFHLSLFVGENKKALKFMDMERKHMNCFLATS